MNKDNRISNLIHTKKLVSDGLEPFPYSASINTQGNKDNEVLFLLSNSGEYNEKIQYKNLKKSILDNSVFLTGNQLISGEKTFADSCTFLNNIYMNEIIDITETGDISGNIFVGQSGLFERLGVGLHFTDRRVVRDVFSDYPNYSDGYTQYNYGGGIDESTYTDGLDFIGIGQPNLNTSVSSYPIYEPSGYYNSNMPSSQQNLENDLSLDGHSFSPDDIHREMGGCWVGIDFPTPFNYKGFSIFRSDIENSAENLKVVASNNGQDWRTIHEVQNLSSTEYNNIGEATSFSLDNYYPIKYSKYRLIAEKIITGNFWKISHFNFSGVETHEFTKSIDPHCTLHVSGDSCFVGDVSATGNSRLEGNYLRVGDSSIVGDIHITGNSFYTGDVYQTGSLNLLGNLSQTGNSYREGSEFIIGNTIQTGNVNMRGDFWHTGDFHLIGNSFMTGDYSLVGTSYRVGNTFLSGNRTQTGNSLIEGSETIAEDLYLGENLYHLGDADTFIQFTDNKISLTAGASTSISLDERNGDNIIFYTSGVEQVRLSKEGFLGINTDAPIGELSVTGDAYLECLLTTGEDGKWERVFGGSDEVVSFVTDLVGGSDAYKIDFPKTFGEKPAVTLSLENNEGGAIVPYFISGVNNSEYYVNFGMSLPNDSYKIHTSVRATGQSSVNKTTTQSFITDLIPGQDSYQVNFPNTFPSTPVVSAGIEVNGPLIPHLVSGISQNSYNIVFGSTLKSACKIHTHAVR